VRWLRPHVLIAAASTGAVLTIAVVDAGRTSPGELATVHGRVPELSEGRGCAECHGGWFATSMADACSECHEVVAAQIEAGAGLHGTLGEAADTCARCHSDHHGSDFPLVNERSFALAGVPDVERFDHGLLGFEMAGRHLELACTECHEHADARPLPAGERRYLGLSATCAACHDDPHEKRLGRDCASCHDQSSFDGHHRVGHDESLPLVGGHAGLDCRTCHASETPYALERLIGPGRRPAPRACATCHDSPHDAPFVRANARAADVTPGASCGLCHAEEHEAFRTESLAVIDALPLGHFGTGFPLVRPHADVECAACHDPAAPFAERYPGRSVDDCAACHEDPHAGQFDASPLASDGCLSCHERVRFEPHGFDVRAHARAALPLTGAHRALDCKECHALEGAVRVFRGTPSSCGACHRDAHDGAFGAHADALETPHGSCAACHDTNAFDRASESFEHGRWTPFALTGAHAQAECTTCHRERPEPDEAARTFGRIEHAFGPYEDCSTCHADPHGGRFDEGSLPAAVDGRTSCARCHGASSFRVLERRFEHARWTGFALHGAHAQAACTACHVPRARPDEHGRTWGAARGTRCADCHADPHAGQFEQRDATDCARCHTSQQGFARLSFRHDRDARFELGPNHTDVACAACHKPVRIGDDQVVRYRPLGRECGDCHDVDRSALRRRRRRKP